jgi:hypothetical protein
MESRYDDGLSDKPQKFIECGPVCADRPVWADEKQQINIILSIGVAAIVIFRRVR